MREFNYQLSTNLSFESINLSLQRKMGDISTDRSYFEFLSHREHEMINKLTSFQGEPGILLEIIYSDHNLAELVMVEANKLRESNDDCRQAGQLSTRYNILSAINELGDDKTYQICTRYYYKIFITRMLQFFDPKKGKRLPSSVVLH